MKHSDCGGKLNVIESFQKEKGNGLWIVRYRKCKKCGAVLHSVEQVPGAKMDNEYKHRNYYEGSSKYC